MTPESVWIEARDLVVLCGGYLVVDDTVVDKPYAEKIDLVRWQWSGTHHDVVKGIGVITLLWTDGDQHIPVDFRVYNPDGDGKTKNQHFKDMLVIALDRGFKPRYVVFNSWFSSLDNLKFGRKHKRKWLTQLKKNRIVDFNEPLESKTIPAEGLRVHLRGYGFVRVFQTDGPNGIVKYWAASENDLSFEKFDILRRIRWRIEEFHHALKQCCGVSRCQARNAVSQLSHITASIMAFIRFEIVRIKRNIS